MPKGQLGPVEARFAALIWNNAPLTSGELVRLSQQALGWKKSTTYTVLRRLCQRGLFQNQDGIVTPLISQDDYAAQQSRQFVAESFAGSLPRFLTAFARSKPMTQEELDQLQQLIDRLREGEDSP